MSLSFRPRWYASADVVVLQCLVERFLRNPRADRGVELREGAVEGAVLHVAAYAGASGGHRVSRRGLGAEHVEAMAFLVVRIDEVDLVVGQVRLREAVLIDRPFLCIRVVER